MIKTQKIIKYCAIALAVFLTFNIIATIMFSIISIGNIFNNNTINDNYITDSLESLEINNTIKILNIDIKGSSITIKEGSNLKVETNNKYIKVKETNDKLSIIEENHNLITDTESNLIIYIPNEYLFNYVSLETGAGKVEVDTINTNKIDLELGAGKVEIQNLNISTEAEIDGGAGELIIANGIINNLDLSMGVGKLTLTASLTGNSEIDAGIGEIELNLKENLDNYKIKINKGIGKATLAGENMKNDTYYGTGSNLINIEGGIGNIQINYSR